MHFIMFTSLVECVAILLHYSLPTGANALRYFGSNEGNYLGQLYTYEFIIHHYSRLFKSNTLVYFHILVLH